MLAEQTLTIGHVQADGPTVWWSERRPSEGRAVVVRAEPGRDPVDLTPPGTDVRTTVHTYGGAPFVADGDRLYFSNYADQRIYVVEPDTEPRAITPGPRPDFAARYADARVTPDGRHVVCVREVHGIPGDTEPRNHLVAVPTDGSAPPRVIAEGHDFYAAPRVSPDGRRLVWITWDHPDMPWDASELWVADLIEDADGLSATGARRVAGGPGESILQPAWGPRGELYYASDRTGWWNLYLDDGAGGRNVYPADAEFAGPHWQFGCMAYGVRPDGRIVCSWSRCGEGGLGVLDPATGSMTPVDLGARPIVERPTGRHVHAGGDGIVLLAAAPDEDFALITLDPDTGSSRVLRRSWESRVGRAYLSPSEPIEFPSSGGRTAYGFFYPPANPDAAGPPGARPPLMVIAHGGPTGNRTAALQLLIHYFTSRGFAVVDVNYGGSSGHGRAYRERLKGMWGVVDVEDCVAAARFLADRGDVDPSRMIIRGSSAGGWTTLCAVAFTDVFAAGMDGYGPSDLRTFVAVTHKFESRYIDSLVAPPERIEVYDERSPLRHADRIRTPLLVLQGTEDEAVPASQSQKIVEALRANGVPVAYVAFEGEGHGFIQPANARRAVELELWFYGRVLGFEPADAIEGVEIFNEDRLGHARP